MPSSGPGAGARISGTWRLGETSPVELIETGSTHAGPERGIALCLSGGGYRAMLFHVGALWRLNEVGLLPKLDRISSVSGGSITAAVLGQRWPRLGFQDGVAQNFAPEVVDSIRGLADRTIDVWAILGGLLWFGSIPDRMIAAYRKHLLGDAMLQDLPDRPRFVFNATNAQSEVLWRFMKPYMRDYRVGEVRHPRLPLAVAVAASAAFPPFLSPVRLRLNPESFVPGSGTDLQGNAYRSEVVLTDGGVYDNLGLETAWKRFDTILVSDGGGKTEPEEKPKRDWARHTYRAINLIQNQVLSLRKRALIASYERGDRKGAYWGITTDISHFEGVKSLPCPFSETQTLARVPTRLCRLEPLLQERLINWGYAVCDAALRKHVEPGLTLPAGFPYPRTGVGDGVAREAGAPGPRRGR
jgi:NTE family protein